MAATEKDHKVIQIARGLEHVPWCDDYERMISGMLYVTILLSHRLPPHGTFHLPLDADIAFHNRYQSFVPELENSRWRARKWCHLYNTELPGLDDPHSTMQEAGKARLEMLKQILGKVGDDAFIEPPFYLDYGCNVLLGDRFYAGVKSVSSPRALLKID